MLAHYDPERPILVSADASSYGVGAVLSHTMEDGIEKPISYASRTLTQAEKKYSQLEKEPLAIIFAVKKIPSISPWQTFHYTVGPQAT